MAKKALDLQLTEEGKVFVYEYLNNGKNASAAFRAAFPNNIPPDRHELVSRAAKYKRTGAVAAALQIAEAKELAKIERVMDKYSVTKEKITEEMAKIAFSNPEDVMSWGPDGVEIRPSSELTPEQKASVAEVSETRNEKTGTTVKIKQYDKFQALMGLAKTLGMLQERVQHEHKHVAVSFVIEGKDD